MTKRHVIDGRVYPYEGWAPFCLRCTTNDRMKTITPESWRCAQCGARHTGPPSWLREGMYVTPTPPAE